MALERLALKLVLRERRLPSPFYLHDVTCSDEENRGGDGYAYIYYGHWNSCTVALKTIRLNSGVEEVNKSQIQVCVKFLLCLAVFILSNFQQFCREAFVWKRLNHEHILPIWGVSTEVFERSVCMVLPWMEKRSVRAYISQRRKEDTLSGQDYVRTVDKWVSILAVNVFNFFFKLTTKRYSVVPDSIGVELSSRRGYCPRRPPRGAFPYQITTRLTYNHTMP